MSVMISNTKIDLLIPININSNSLHSSLSKKLKTKKYMTYPIHSSEYHAQFNNCLFNEIIKYIEKECDNVPDTDIRFAVIDNLYKLSK